MMGVQKSAAVCSKQAKQHHCTADAPLQARRQGRSLPTLPSGGMRAQPVQLATRGGAGLRRSKDSASYTATQQSSGALINS